MNSGINLLQHKSKTVSGSAAKWNQRLRFIALSFLVIIPLCSVLLFLFIFFSPLSSLQQQEKSSLTATSILQKKTASIAFINDRVEKSVQFIAQRSVYRQALQEIVAKLPNDVMIGTLSMQTDKIALAVTSASLSSLKTYQDNLMSIQTGQVMHAVTFQSVSLADGSGYEMSLTATIHE